MDNIRLENKLVEHEVRLTSLTEDLEKEKQNYYKEKDEPVRLGKGNDNIRKGVNHLNSELEKLVQEHEHLDSHLKKED